MKTKTLKQWEKSNLDLDEFLHPGDYITEELQLQIGECVPPVYCTQDFLQGGDPDKKDFTLDCFKKEFKIK